MAHRKVTDTSPAEKNIPVLKTHADHFMTLAKLHQALDTVMSGSDENAKEAVLFVLALAERVSKGGDQRRDRKTETETQKRRRLHPNRCHDRQDAARASAGLGIR